ncbi:hypothetical protein B0H11DRAFT_2223377 [Mycena galericulata]|nr:hypothetical protein B0H11DRAFT_2223377 [Mycena galericulata]
MTSLTIQCSLPGDRRMKRQRGLPLTLQLVGDPGYEEEEWIVKNVERIRITALSFVSRATIYRPDNLPLDAVLKLDPTGERQEAFMKEAQTYQTIGQKLQGSILPVFYGCFQAQVGATMVTCVATEYCGEPMEQALHEIDNPFLSKLLLYVVAMHHNGMSHGALYPRNIRVCHGRPVFIDLELSKSHKCGLRMKIIPGAMWPTVEEYGCPELHDLVCRMRLWKPDTLHFCVHDIVKSSIHSVDDIIHFTPKYHGPEQRKIWEDKAARLYEELCEERLLTYGTDKISRMHSTPPVIFPY